MNEFADHLRRAAAENAKALVPDWVFAEEPVSLSVFVQDRAYLGNPPLSDEQYDAVHHIERIYYPSLYPQMAKEFDPAKPDVLQVGAAGAFRAERYWAEPVRMTNFITLQWGKGSGKDHVCRIASMRIAYLLMCLRSPQDYYGMPDQDTIHLLNVAMSSTQAQQAFFIPITRTVKKGWFKNRCQPKQNFVSFEKNVEAISGHSDAETQEGLNLILGIADEIDGFKSKKETQTRKGASAREPTKSAESILKMIRTSGATRFPETFKNVRISYPRYLGSTIQHLTDQARADLRENGQESRHFVSGPLATWQVNPRVKGAEAFAQDYRDDPVMARAMYECKPARAVNPYFRNHNAIDACFVPREVEPLSLTYGIERGVKRDVWVPRYSFASDFYPIRGAAYAMHADLAVMGDRAGIAMAHVVKWIEDEQLVADEDGAMHPIREVRPHVKVDFCMAYAADITADPPREIQIRWARQLCFELRRRGFNIQSFTFDTFQCMSGDTEIPLLDGSTRKLRELEGTAPFWLYSIKDGRVVPGLCTKAWKTGHRTDMLEVELDNGETLRTTSDHRFMLRDGTYRRADRLQSGDSLMPLYRRHKRISPSSTEYEQVWHPEADGSGQRWRFTHSLVSQHAHGKLPKGWVTHHANLNPFDNRPENLKQLTSAEHTRLHKLLGEAIFKSLWAQPEWAAQHRQRLSELRTAEQTGKTGEASRRFRTDVSLQDIENVHAACIAGGVVPTRAEVERRLNCSQPLLYGRLRAAGYGSWKAFRDAREGVSDKNRYHRAWKAARKATEADQNHLVVAVRQSTPEDVYDLQVDQYHNFAVAAGVFVHNSFDSMQILEAAGIECKKVSTDLKPEIWRSLRDVMYEGRLKAPRPPVPDNASFLLRDELLSLTRLPNGRIDHPSDGSKDLADAFACAVLGAIEVGGAEEASDARTQYGAPDIEVGSYFDLPLGVRASRIWERELPSPY